MQRAPDREPGDAQSKAMISFIVPAHNEEFLIGRCLSSIHESMRGAATSYEIMVVDDESADRTGAIAEECEARVMRVRLRQISAVRNAGAKAARGDIFMFVDADTMISEGVVASALEAIRAGAIGGGCAPRFDGPLPLWWRLICPVVVWAVRWWRMPGGAFQFCTRSAFTAVGGFSEAHYAVEDALFASALKRHGRFVVLRETVMTSGRNLRNQSLRSASSVLLRFALRGTEGFRSRKGLDIWYAPKRERGW